MFALFKVKKWSIFCFFWFYFSKISFSLQKQEDFWKTRQKQQKTQILKLKSGPITLRNIIGPLFNFNLAHFLTLEFC